MAVANFQDLLEHVGHEIECVAYGDHLSSNKSNIVNVAIECVTCGVVLVDFDADNGGHTI